MLTAVVLMLAPNHPNVETLNCVQLRVLHGPEPCFRPKVPLPQLRGVLTANKPQSLPKNCRPPDKPLQVGSSHPVRGCHRPGPLALMQDPCEANTLPGLQVEGSTLQGRCLWSWRGWGNSNAS